MSFEYHILIKERIDPNWFEELAVSYTEENYTVLKGIIQDQPALHGILDRIRNLNLTLLSLTKIEPENGKIQFKE